MQATLRALLTEVIDYAGMFPPASLPLEQSIRNYLRYRTEPESWMLGRFICPAARLHELTPYLQGVDTSKPVVISALGKGGGTVPEFMDNLKQDGIAIDGFREQIQGRAVVDAFEVRLPIELWRAIREQFPLGVPNPVSTVHCFIEAGNCPASMKLWPVPDIRSEPYYQMSCGFKYRCGGNEPGAYPSPKELAAVIEGCCEIGESLKFTAGLHHPIRHYNAAAGVKMHGFINVFVAALLHKTHRVPAEPILADEDASHFLFTDTEVRWKECKLSAEAVRLIRQFRDKVVSFGSCSFDEPRDDLRKLGWLP